MQSENIVNDIIKEFKNALQGSDQTLNKAQLKTVLAKCGCTFEKHEFDAWFSVADKDKSHTIDVRELVKFI